MVMDADSLKELGLSVGQRLNVLKSVYLVKLAHDIPIGDDDYIPPCALMAILALSLRSSDFQPRLRRSRTTCRWTRCTNV
jgi:hypothetical protein